MSTLIKVFGGSKPVFLDDDERTAGQNAQPATASIVGREIILADQLAHAGHPLYSWAFAIDGQPTISALELTSCFRQVYMPANKGNFGEGGEILGLPHDQEADPGFQDGQGFTITIGAESFPAYWNYSTSPVVSYPEDLRAIRLSQAYGYSTIPAEIVIGGVTSDWPQPRAGTIWQDPTDLADSDQASSAGVADVHTKGEIIATRGTGVEHLTALVNVFRDTWFHQRPQGGWSTVLPGQVDAGGAGTTRGVHFSTSPTSYRYIFDQTYGDAGTAITATSPAMTLPLHHAGGGLGTQVRVYVFIYAAMTGGTDTGAFAIANKNSAGSMNSPTTLTNFAGTPQTISGTTFQWYPTLATWAATTAPYFLGYTGSAFDRVALCAKSLGATDQVVVGAFTFVVAPSTT